MEKFIVEREYGGSWFVEPGSAFDTKAEAQSCAEFLRVAYGCTRDRIRVITVPTDQVPVVALPREEDRMK